MRRQSSSVEERLRAKAQTRRALLLRKLYSHRIPGWSTIRKFIGSVSFPPLLFQQSIHIDFATRADEDTTISDYRDHETRCKRGTIAFAVLFRRVDRLVNVLCIERIEYCRPVCAIPCFCRDCPHDGVLTVVCRNRRRSRVFCYFRVAGKLGAGSQAFVTSVDSERS